MILVLFIIIYFTSDKFIVRFYHVCVSHDVFSLTACLSVFLLHGHILIAPSN